jgi:GPI mannosyltransferase 3
MLTYFTQPPFRRIAYAGLAIQVLAAFFTVGYNHPDEHWQVLEFANYKLGFSPAADLPWEFGEQIRQAWQPFLAFLIGKGLLALNLYSPFTLALILRLLTALAGYAATLQIIAIFLREPSLENYQKPALWLASFLWFLPYNRAHFHSETLSGVFFFLGLAVVLRALRQTDKRQWGQIFLSGVLMGTAFESRFQIAFGILATVVWLLVYQRPTFGQAVVGIAGFCLIIGLGILIDRWFYGDWVLTAYRYFDVNILQSKASNWGVSPFWYYPVLVAETAAPPLSIFLIVGTFVAMFAYPRHVLTWIFVLMLLGHSLVPHKEVRFLFPLIFALPVVLVLAWKSELWQKVIRSTPRWLQRTFVYLLLFENMVLLAVATLKPANESAGTFAKVYEYADDQPITLYTLDTNPYFWTDLAIHFYRPRQIEVRHFDSIDSLIAQMQAHPREKKLFFYYGFALEEKYPKEAAYFRPLHRTIPTWLKYFNFGNWISRTRIWCLYEFEPSAVPPSALRR